MSVIENAHNNIHQLGVRFNIWLTLGDRAGKVWFTGHSLHGRYSEEFTPGNWPPWTGHSKTWKRILIYTKLPWAQ